MLRRVLGSTALLLLSATLAYAQAGVTVSGKAGFGSTTGDVGAAVGGSLTVDLTDRAALEADGTYLAPGDGTSVFALTGALRLDLLTGGPRTPVATPYLLAGLGWHRASFDLGNARYLGSASGGVAPGALVCPGAGMGFGAGPGFGAGTCTGTNTVGAWGVNQLPQFYARRLGALTVPAGTAWGTRVFNDPAIVLGGGVEFGRGTHFSIRPDARAIVAFGSGRAQSDSLFTLSVGYRF